VIVDVRDDDFKGGNIKDCFHLPSQDFQDNVGGLAMKLKGVPKVIFHCALSQARGPKCARIYSETLDALSEKVDTEESVSKPQQPEEQEILVLRNGFTGFQDAYKNDPDLVENFDQRYWE